MNHETDSALSIGTTEAASHDEVFEREANPTDDWKAAWERAHQIRRQWEAAIGTPGLNTSHVLNRVIGPLLTRYYDGERTPELFEGLRALRSPAELGR